MFSAPPATTTSASPSITICAAETIACSPDPHSRLSVNAGVSTGNPALIVATRERYMSWTSVWMTLPNTTCPISPAATPARLTASRTTVAASSVGGWSLRLPPYLPIAVRTPLSRTTSRSLRMADLLLSPHGEHGAPGRRHDAPGHAAEEELRQSRPPVGADHDQVRPRGACRAQDLLLGRALGEQSARAGPGLFRLGHEAVELLLRLGARGALDLVEDL